MGLHDDEVAVDEVTARALLTDNDPAWADLSFTPAGGGTDNVMFRLGEELLVRLPRTPGTARDVAKEQLWLPRLAPHLPLAVPQPVAEGRPGHGYPFVWSVYRWIPGQPADTGRLADPASFGRDLAGFVRALHAIPLMGVRREGALRWYRGEPLGRRTQSFRRTLDVCRRLDGLELDLDAVDAVFADSLAAPEPRLANVWMHADLKPSNLLIRDDRLVAVIDFGGLSIGDPTCEHAATWDLPEAARTAYRTELDLDQATWRRARGWALVIALAALPYYWTSWPAFVRESLARITTILRDADGNG